MTRSPLLAIPVFVALLALAACPPKPPVPTGPTDAEVDAAPRPITQPGVCAVSTPAPVTANVCARRFTADDKACVRCPGSSGCIFAKYQIYCVGPAGCRDPLCQPR